MTEKPWSAQREQMWRQVTFALASLALLLLMTAVCGKLLHNARVVTAALPTAIGLGIIAAGCFLILIAHKTNPNRPIGDLSLLTPWERWPNDSDVVPCACKEIYRFHSDATWSPNEGRQGTDPGGGRWCIVCKKCGRGHYKFNVGNHVGTGAKER